MQEGAPNVKPILTIAIPTYNRAKFLELALKRIGDELDSLDITQRRLVRICIANNASTDNTTEVLTQNPRVATNEFEVVRNVTNLGGEENVARCYREARTPYVWVIGDDDVILEGGLKIVMQVLLQQKPDILYVGNYHFSDYYWDRPKKMMPENICVYDSAIEFARRTNVMLTFISALIINKDASIDFFPERVIGSNLPQLAWVFPLLSEGRCFVIIEKWIVAAKAGNTGGYGLVEVFGKNLNRIAEDLLAERAELRKVIQNGVIVNFFPNFVLKIREGLSSFKDRDMQSEFKKIYGGNWRYYLFLFPLLVLPMWGARRYQLVARGIRRLVRPILV